MASLTLSEEGNITANTGLSTVDVSKLIHEVTKNISKVMEQKLSKLTNALDKIAGSLEGCPLLKGT